MVTHPMYPRAPGTPLGNSYRAESLRDLLWRDAYLLAFIGQSRADDFPCRSAATDEIFKDPISNIQYIRAMEDSDSAILLRVFFWFVKVGNTPRTSVWQIVRCMNCNAPPSSQRKEKTKKNALNLH
ncbi:hypothetical protein EVAR_37403_1 [Eumeta japonica]|uniref:Uncharacterized protein n=1 Tax=Eumeta variegata TaxID=151549 RepID=A0A4C1WEQ8_EUMVA|nr:hypothetical protein EVAR_37403_1 [Eumeta japonica]